MGTSTVSELVALLKDKDRNVRASAAKELGENMEPDAVPALVEALKDQDANMRYCAAYALAEFGAEAKAAVPALIDALKDQEEWYYDCKTHGRVSASASFALSKIDPEAARKAGVQ